MTRGEESGETRPSVAAYFAELDESATPFLTALGQVVVAVAALEGSLRLELARLLFTTPEERENPTVKALQRLEELETLSAGQLLRLLREQGLPENLERRIDDVIARRNRLVHHLFEDPQLVEAMAGTESSDDAIGKLQQLALDCASVAVELQLFALPKIEASMGVSKQELLDFVVSLNPAQIHRPAVRNQLETIQALASAAGWVGHSGAAQIPSDPWGLDTHHRVTTDWLGEQVETLADLLRPGLRAVCVGINPSPVSVAAGHYYQGQIGRRFWQRLHQAGVIEETGTGREDDAAFLAGIGFTDIVKRPTARAEAISATEFERGRELLIEKLRRHRPALLIFTFKRPATALFGPFKGHGHRPELKLEGAEIFVLPGPYERTDRVATVLEQLKGLLTT